MYLVQIPELGCVDEIIDIADQIVVAEVRRSRGSATPFNVLFRGVEPEFLFGEGLDDKPRLYRRAKHDGNIYLSSSGREEPPFAASSIRRPL